MYLAKQELISLQKKNSTNAAQIICNEIKKGMLADDPKRVDAEIKEVIQNKWALSLAIFNDKGEERGSGAKGNPSVVKALQTGQAVTGEKFDNGTHILETYLPLANEEGCKSCHDADVKILGVLKLDSSIEQAYDATKRSSMILGLWGLAALMASVVCLTIALRRLVTSKIDDFVSKITDLSKGDGDLTKRLDTSGNDELGEVNKQFNHFVNTLDIMIAHSARTAVHLAASAGSIQAFSQNMSKGVGDAASQATSVATAGEEMSATSADIAQNCSKAAESSRYSNQLATEGASVIRSTVEGMTRIAARVKSTALVIEGLGARSDQIGDIVGTIGDIADQTNLLALNAAIEAARAGEQGRGFAVVADEVRALAERTTRATREIGEMIKAIQRETKMAVDTMEEGVAEVAKGTEEAARSGEALQGILQQIGEVTHQINQIATAAEEQTATTSEISSNIHKITDAFAKTARTAEETSTEAEKLNKLSEELQDTVKGFRTRESELLMLTVAANDHRLFVNKVRAAVIGDVRIEAGDLADHHSCRFGKWYDSAGRQLCGELSSFQAINAVHERIHSLAKETVSVVNSGNRSRAAQLMQEVDCTSLAIMDGLEDIRDQHLSRVA
ncbi:MAG: hypothetical protein A2075_08475 [Geobacteraceae bacterium GWC2_58_44]|nr:MAG: hypothetical protein A2075_08475 [Geobacteraceae bacterium GWC2_58_44]